uniref:N-acetyltransferase domain-containing protein n=1 Tax=Anopheles atroparvus TaxID=41427 RepID=A0AAG5DFG6_ANOAO
MANDRLEKIPRCDWEEWRDLYLRDWPRYELSYNTVQNYINWSKRDPKIKDLAIYSLNGSWRENGTYIIIDRIDLYMDTLEESTDTLRRALHLVDWDYYYVAVMCQYDKLLFETFEKLDVMVFNARPNTMYFLAKEKALTLSWQVPEGLRLGPLLPSHAKFINDLWPHRETGSEFYLERFIRWNVSMGLFDDREGGTLLGWCVLMQKGAMASLGVAERRKGYGTLVVKAFAKKLAELGHNSYASVLVDNEPSKALFESVGFKAIGRVNWVRNCERKFVEWSSGAKLDFH